MRDSTQVTIPPYEDKIGEPVHIKRARLVSGKIQDGLGVQRLTFLFAYYILVLEYV